MQANLHKMPWNPFHRGFHRVQPLSQKWSLLPVFRLALHCRIGNHWEEKFDLYPSHRVQDLVCLGHNRRHSVIDFYPPHFHFGLCEPIC